ncbi:flagellar biosynthesis anti-sigma factor FlgM [Bacillus carboniphilus]|uniref:Negative regulator of flagellin synthesis n=1 Tax=Bacillus carboniphilus TaxID=86663 RepID=A0ABY9JUY4_9BACI|nr:flagellar biosynthesis anti-sigma factor FlgM [Bacillus carboniphilus]WLR41491.1 flagellar biosynthesis anti-sigma factor FlgM [Bacillus carboniphilus]
MKINASLYQVQLQGLQQKNHQVQSKKPSNQEQDQVEISNEAKKLQLKENMTTDREVKMENLKKQIEKGQYQLDSKAIAHSLINHYSKEKKDDN